MLELAQGTILERAIRLTLSSAFQLTQDAEGIPLLDLNPAGSFLTQAAADARYGQLGAVNTWSTTNVFSGAVRGNTNIRAGALSEGWVQLTSGGGSNIGYVEWYTPANVRQAYLGFSATGLNMTVEAGNFVINTGPNFAVMLANATAAWFQWPAVGVAPPTFTTARSIGTKLVLYPLFTAGSSADYAIGVDSGVYWFGLPTTGQSWKWYGGITIAATLTGLGALTLSSTLAVNGAALDLITAGSGGPTAGNQIVFGTSSVVSAVGTMFSSGNFLMTYNAKQNTYNADSWLQSNGAIRSSLLELGAGGLAFYTAVAGKATAVKATFWGATPLFQITDSVGQLRLLTSQTYDAILATAQVGTSAIGLTFTNTGGRVFFGVDSSAGTAVGAGAYNAYVWTEAARNVVIGVNNIVRAVFATAGYLSLNGNLNLDFNYGNGMVGLYDPAKYRMVYAIGDAYKMSAGGTSLTGFYGMAYVHDGTLTLTGKALGHGMINVNNGTINSYFGELGFWTNGDYWVSSTRVAKITWGGGAPSGAAPIGTIYIQTS